MTVVHQIGVNPPTANIIFNSYKNLSLSSNGCIFMKQKAGMVTIISIWQTFSTKTYIRYMCVWMYIYDICMFNVTSDKLMQQLCVPIMCWKRFIVLSFALPLHLYITFFLESMITIWNFQKEIWNILDGWFTTSTWLNHYLLFGVPTNNWSI